MATQDFWRWYYENPTGQYDENGTDLSGGFKPWDYENLGNASAPREVEGMGADQRFIEDPVGTKTAPGAKPLSFKQALDTTFRNLTNFKDWNPLKGGNAADPTGAIAAFAGNKETQPIDYFATGSLSKDQDFRDAGRMVGRVVAGNAAAGALGAVGTEGATAGTAGFETGGVGAVGGAAGQAPIAAGGEGADALSSGGGMGEWDWLEGMDMGGGYDPGSLGGLDAAGDATLPGAMAGSASASGMSLADLAGAAKSIGITQASLASLLKRMAPAALGALGASQQANAFGDLAARYEGYGAPSRVRYESSMTPGFDPNSIPGYSGALDSASKSILAKLSSSGGNPFGNPGGLIDAQKQIVSGTALPAINEFQRLNAATGFGQTLQSAGGFGQGEIGAQGNIFNAVGAGLNDVMNPPQTFADQIKAMKEAGLFSKYSL